MSVLPDPTADAWQWPGPADEKPFAAGDHLPAAARAGTLSRYGDDVWDLSPLSVRVNEPGRRINWAAFPAPLRPAFKRAGWALVNLPMPDQLLQRPATSRVRFPSTGTIASTTQHWRRYGAWLADQGITDLGQVDATVLEDYAVHLAASSQAARTCGTALAAITTLWGLAVVHLPHQDRFPMPPWESEGLAHYLPATATSNDNRTPPVHPSVMSPLLVWALRFVEDFAPDILAALAEHQRLKASIPASTVPDAGPRVRALLDEHARTGRPLPGEVVKGRRSVASTYLAAVTGAGYHQLNNILGDYPRLPVADAAPLDITITGRVHQRPWLDHISFSQALQLGIRLNAACLIVLAYLSGARATEILHLQVGCCPEPDPHPDGPRRYRVHGAVYKDARTPDDRAAADGTPHQWTVILPVVAAVAVLEQLTDSRHLFPLRPHWLAGLALTRSQRATGGTRGRRARGGPVVTTKAANGRIGEFITWVNDYAAAHDLPGEAIPADPHGPVTLSRFRRTLAWHIARRPGGRVALAIQYAHLRTTTSEGYSARARHGLHHLLDIETARAMVDHLHHLGERLQHGEAVSGPAAGRLLDAARAARARFEGVFLSPRQVRALLNDPHLQVHDNPDAFLTCAYDPARALCHPSRQATTDSGRPQLDRCDPACTNIARTDQDLTHLAAHIDRLRAETADPLTPAPLRERLTQRVTALERIADQHARTSQKDTHALR